MSDRKARQLARVRDLEGRPDGQRYVYAIADGLSVGHIGTSHRVPRQVWHTHESYAMNADPTPGTSTSYVHSRPQSQWVRERSGRFEVLVLEVLRPGADALAAKLRWQGELYEAGMEVPEVHEVPGPVSDRHQGKISGRLKGRAKTPEHRQAQSRGRQEKIRRSSAAGGAS